MTPADTLDAIRYPIGRVTIVTDVTPADRSRWIAQIADAPAKLRSALAGLSDQQLDRHSVDDQLRAGGIAAAWSADILSASVRSTLITFGQK